MASHVLVVDNDPVEHRLLREIVQNASSARLKRRRSNNTGVGDLLLRTPSMERAIAVAERAARMSVPVLIEGERGSGKELVGRAVHAASSRRSKPFVAVHASAVRPAEAQTGDDASAFQLDSAHGGTLYIDEIGALSPPAQAGLLRLLEGPARPRRPDIRLIAATGRRLIDFVSDGSFREDLFNHLNVLPIWLPPLRERAADIPDLANNCVRRLAAEQGRSISGLSDDALDLLMRYAWPGNLRELENAIYRAVLFCSDDRLSPRDFRQLPCAAGGTDTEVAVGMSENAAPGVADQRQSTSEQKDLAAPRPDRSGIPRYGVSRLLDEGGELRSFGALEEEVIRFAVGHYRGHMSEVARRLGIGRSTLYRKLKDYGIASEETVAP